MKQNRLIFTTLAALALLAASCSEEQVDNNSGSTPGTMVRVTLPVQVEDAIPAPVAARTKAAVNSPQEGFSVSFGDEAPQTTTKTSTPSTRAIARELTNVWVLQFNSTGTNVSTTNVGNLAANAPLSIPALEVGTGYTIYVVADGPASGFTTSSPATLADFENQMLHTTPVTNATKLPLSGKLTRVEVVDLGDGKGALKLMDASTAVTLTRIHAEITLTVDFGVTEYNLTGAELYNVPIGVTYGWDSANTKFPDNTVAANFDYTSTASAGKSSLTPTISGTKTTYKWFLGDNRRGDVAGLTDQPDRNRTKAPAYATFARITLTNTTESNQKIFYDVYLGSETVTNFDVMRNHTYTLNATIKGKAEAHEALIDIDERMSGTGIPIYLTETRAHSPIIVSFKNTESTSTMHWGPETTIPAAKDFFNGKANTDVLMAISATDYPAAKYCRDLGAKFYLPSKAELMLMWVYLPAIPEAERTDANLWTSTESMFRFQCADNGRFSNGFMLSDNKTTTYTPYNHVRCVREHL